MYQTVVIGYVMILALPIIITPGVSNVRYSQFLVSLNINPQRGNYADMRVPTKIKYTNITIQMQLLFIAN